MRRWFYIQLSGFTIPGASGSMIGKPKQHLAEEIMLSHLSRCLARRAAAVIVVGIGFAAASQVQDRTFELKLSHWVPPSHPLQKAMEEWGAAVERASKGTIKYKV